MSSINPAGPRPVSLDQASEASPPAAAHDAPAPEAQIRRGSAPGRPVIGAAAPSTFRDGPMSIPFKLDLGGRSVDAELVGSLRSDRFVGRPDLKSADALRVKVGGDDLKLTDAAMSAILASKGLSWDAENSSQTEVLHRGLSALVGKSPRVVHYDGASFRLVKRDDFEGGSIYFHSGDIAVEKPAGR
jgi:hypothetical protein